MLTLICLIVVLLETIQRVETTNNREVKNQLLENLLGHHNSRIIPVGVEGDLFQVVFRPGIVQIIDIDEKNQIMDATFYVSQSWTDEELTWSPEENAGIQRLVLPDHSIWAPDIDLINNMDVPLSLDSKSTFYFHVDFAGLVTHTYIVNYRSSCTMHLRNFPFDRQNCSLTFTSRGYLGSQLNVTIDDNKQEIPYENSEFYILDREVSREIDNECCGEPMIRLHYHVIFQRRPLFYILNMLLPSCVFTLLAMFGFCVPPESGERVGLGVTVLLSLTVFLLIVSDVMPPSTEPPLIGIYYFAVIIMVTFSTVLSILTLSLHQNAGNKRKEVPRWIKASLFDHVATWLCLDPLIDRGIDPRADMFSGTGNGREVGRPLEGQNRFQNRFQNTVEPQGTDAMCDSQSREEESPTMDKIHNDEGTETIIKFIKSHEIRREKEEQQENIKMEWRFLLLILDRMTMCFFIVMYVVLTLWMVLQAAYGGDY